MLNNSGKNGRPDLIPDLKANALSFSPLRIMFCAVCCNGLYYVEIGFLYAHFLESFCHKSVLNFVKSFCCTYRNKHMIFILVC